MISLNFFLSIRRKSASVIYWQDKEGRTDEIAHCICCLYCFESLLTVRYVRCFVNLKAGREAVFHEEPVKDGNGRKVAVVGGGVAGMKASAVLGQRGFDVTLYEKDEKLGGEVNLACATAPYKDKVGWLVTTLCKEMENAGVHIKLGTEATHEMVKADGPEAVFLATGGKPIVPNLPGIDGADAVGAYDVIRGKVTPSGKIVVAGGCLTGLETAEKLFRENADLDITVVDMLPKIGMTMYPTIFDDVMKQMEGRNLTLKAGCMLKEVTAEGIRVTKTDDQSEECIPADCVILAMGTRADKACIKAFEDTFDHVIPIGQTAENPGRIATSVFDGYTAARGFEPNV